MFPWGRGLDLPPSPPWPVRSWSGPGLNGELTMLSRLPRFLGHGGSMGNLCQCYDTVPPYAPLWWVLSGWTR